MNQLEADGFVVVSHEDAMPTKVIGGLAGYLAEISDFVDDISAALWPLNWQIHDNPELGFQEVQAHKRLTAFFEDRIIGEDGRWTVKREAYGMHTAWVASFDSGRAGPVVSFNVEMDALPGIGHACGHNLIATASVAGSLAAAEIVARHRLGGKIVVFGTPAEEGSGGGKIRLIEAGAYRDYKADVSLITHPGTAAPCAQMRTTATSGFVVSYIGRAAHAAASPWEGINALDALILAYNGLGLLRQQTMPGDIIQGRITDGGAADNIIHEHAAGSFGVRAPTKRRLEQLLPRVESCFRAGADGTGARLVLDKREGYADHVPNKVLARAYTKHWNNLVADDNTLTPDEHISTDLDSDEARGSTAASTDQGDVSYALPSLSVGFRIHSTPINGGDGPGGGPHTPDFERAAGTRDAFHHAMRAGKALAATALDILTVEGLLDEVKKDWKKDMKEAGGC